MQEEKDILVEKTPLKSIEDVNEALNEIEKQEQLYSIALFDVLGFSDFVNANATETILNLYNNLLDMIHNQESSPDGRASSAGNVVPVRRTSNDWKNNSLIADANGYVRATYFSDTIILYVHYSFSKQSYWLRDSLYEPYPLLQMEPDTKFAPLFYDEHKIYISFLNTCMDFFCQSIVNGIPLRGCISTGMALMDSEKSIYFGDPVIEAARGESVQNSLGIAFGKSFNNYHPVYGDYYIPYTDHIKKNSSKAEFLCPMVPDWARYWRKSRFNKNYSFHDCIKKMNTKPGFSSYYENAIKFYDFSEKNENWSHQIERTKSENILDFYSDAKKWLGKIK